MLRQDVVDAVLEGKFHIYTAGTIDEGIEVLTSVEAGVRAEDGSYPESSINYLVDKQLKVMAEKLRHFQAPADNKGKSKRAPKAEPPAG